MKIGIDARPLTVQRAGIGNYVHGLVQLLPKIAPEHEYFLYANREITSPLSSGVLRERRDRAFRFCPGSFWLAARGGGMARRDRLDVFWSTAAILPHGIPTGVLKIITVYDLVWLRLPETMTRYNRLVQNVFARRAIGSADLIVVISRSTGEELVRLLGVPRAKIRLVYPGISESYRPCDPEKAAEYISNKYGVSRRYLAAVGTLEPRKNLKLLVEVLRILKSSVQLDCPLLVVGASGWKNSDLFRQIQAAGLTEKEIRFLGYLPDEDLPFFYAGAQLFLFPSLYEGFGFPPLEAMACGTPVIASDALCMPETLKDAAILESPSRPERFASGISMVLRDENLRGAMRTKGFRCAQRFRWGSSAQQLIDVFRRAAEAGQIDSCQRNWSKGDTTAKREPAGSSVSSD